MADKKKIKTALVSVFHKDGLDELLKKLNEEKGITIVIAENSMKKALSSFLLVAHRSLLSHSVMSVRR